MSWKWCVISHVAKDCHGNEAYWQLQTKQIRSLLKNNEPLIYFFEKHKTGTFITTASKLKWHLGSRFFFKLQLLNCILLVTINTSTMKQFCTVMSEVTVSARRSTVEFWSSDVNQNVASPQIQHTLNQR